MRKVGCSASHVFVTCAGNRARQRCDLSDHEVFPSWRCLGRKHARGQTQGGAKGMHVFAQPGSLLRYQVD